MISAAALGDVAEFVNGAAFKPEDWGSDGLPIIRIQNLTDPTKAFNRTLRTVPDRLRVRAGDLLVSWSATLGVFEWAGPGDGLLNQHIFRVLPDKSKVDKRYLRHGLERAITDMQMHLHGATMQHVNRGAFLGTQLYLPSITEQRRIAEVLDRAETLRAQRRQALAQLDALGESIFLSLLNDPASAPWARPTIGEIATTMRTGPFGSQLLHSEFVESGIAVLGIDNVVQNRFVWARPRYITESKFSQLERYRVEAGDVLITIMGTCGRCAIVPDDVPLAINTKHLCCIRLDQRRCLPTYLQTTLLRHPEVLYRLGVHERGAVMPGLNMQLIRDLEIALPPLAVQRRFKAAMRSVSDQQQFMTESLKQLEALFASLQHRAFRGEL